MAWNSFFSGFKDGWDTSMDTSEGGSGLWVPSFFNGLLEGVGSWWKDMTGQTSNEKINAENVAMQQKNLDYQMALQQEIFNREDTAYSRTAQDMRQVGLNSLSMKGTNGSGSVVPTQAPKKEFEAINSMPLIISALNELNSLSVGQAQRDNINAQTRNINAQTSSMEFEHNFQKRIRNHREYQYALDTFYKDIDLQDKTYNHNMKKVTGYSENDFLNVMNMTRLAEGYTPISFDSDLSLNKNGKWTHTTTSTGDMDFNYLIDNARKSLMKDFIKNLSIIKLGK